MLGAITRSVRYKAMVVTLAATLAALIVSAMALLTYEVRKYRDQIVANATTLADIVARTSAPSIQFNDANEASEHLAILAASGEITAAAIYTSDGRLFARYTRNGETLRDLPSVASRRGLNFAGGNLQLMHPIVENGQTVGTVYLRAAYDVMTRVRDYLLILVAVMLLSFIAAAAITVRLQRSVTAPVLAVSRLARRVVETRDFTLRARKTTDDEIGVLVDSFNTMLAEVGQRTTELEESNRRLLRETEERRSAEEALRQADRRKDEFLATLSHELRNPLAPMVTALTLLERSTHPPLALDILKRQLAQMVRLVDDLLDVSRITRGKLAVKKQRVLLADVIDNATDTIRPLIERRDQTLEVTLPGTAIEIDGDPVRLAQVFSNLLHNAAKYTDPGGRIAIAADADAAQVRVAVTDTGAGIEANVLPFIFEMFTQGDASVERAQSGLGVGLALTKRLVELHGGAIRAQSAGPGRGTTLTVELPLAVAATHPPPERQAAASSRPRAAPPRRVLLVDDNVDFATSLAMLLGTLGHEVRIAHDADRAVEEARELAPEIAFLDIGMPVISGYELARRLRALPETRGTFLVALSGWGQPQDRRRSSEAGFGLHLVKPVQLETLESVLLSLEGHRPGRL